MRNKLERARNNVQRMMAITMNVPEPPAKHLSTVEKHLPATYETLANKFGKDLIFAMIGYRQIFLANIHDQFTDQSLIVTVPYSYENFFT